MRRSVALIVMATVLAALWTGLANAGEKKIIRISNGVNDVHPAVLGGKKFKEVVEAKVG